MAKNSFVGEVTFNKFQKILTRIKKPKTNIYDGFYNWHHHCEDYRIRQKLSQGHR